LGCYFVSSISHIKKEIGIINALSGELPALPPTVKEQAREALEECKYYLSREKKNCLIKKIIDQTFTWKTSFNEKARLGYQHNC